MMPHLSVLPLLLAAVAGPSSAFVPHLPSPPSTSSTEQIGTKIGAAHVVLASAADANDAAGADDDAAAAPPTAPGSEDETAAATPETKKKKATLGFITFDLDDTLYPVGPVFTEANQA